MERILRPLAQSFVKKAHCGSDVDINESAEDAFGKLGLCLYVCGLELVRGGL